MCKDVIVLWLLWQLGVAQWRARGLGGDMRARPVSSSWGLRILWPMQALVSPSDSILFSFLIYFKHEHFNIYVSLLWLKNSCYNSSFGPCMYCIMRQCFGVDTSYGSWLGLTTLAYGWDVTRWPTIFGPPGIYRSLYLRLAIANSIQLLARSSRVTRKVFIM
jgi:hypothetical protein